MPSYAYTIAQSAVAVIQAISSPPGLTVLRSTDSLINPDLSNDANFPMCILTMPNPEGKLEFEAFGGSIGRSYQIFCSVYRKANAQVQTNTDVVPSLTLAIEQALNLPSLTGASTVYDTQLVPFTQFETWAQKQGFEVSKAAVVFYSAESRNG